MNDLRPGQGYRTRKGGPVWRVGSIAREPLDSSPNITLERDDATLYVTPGYLDRHFVRVEESPPHAHVQDWDAAKLSVQCGCGATGVAAVERGRLLCPKCGAVWLLSTVQPLERAQAYDASLLCDEIVLDIP